ncbi:hypothetical protein CHS0354_016467 [Potamilus streckersoni]|uniref:G-protein coupled receptors family 1 profile domain-containing protein n=1 Tax=Potamilus streckersoni TaxID=2493646 RepID=A0AAE0TJQ1_9BIVA|nr:hypothetical protein CHS0354_016467 [Potamilus streckersoni]
MAMPNVTNNQDLLEQLHYEATRVLIPTIVYVAVLLILGAMGNSCVIFYYRFKAKYTPHSYFILVLAVFDFCLCALCMPMEILELRPVYRVFLFGVLASSPILFFHNIIRVNVTSLQHYEVEQAQKGFRKTKIDSLCFVSKGSIGDLNRISLEYVKDGQNTISLRRMNSKSTSHSSERNSNTSRRAGNDKTRTALEVDFQEPTSHVAKSSNDDESNKISYIHNTKNCERTDNEIDVIRESGTLHMKGESQRNLETKDKSGFQTPSRTFDLQSRKFTLSMLLLRSLSLPDNMARYGG